MKELIRNIYEKLAQLFLSVPLDKRLHFGAGFLIATVCAIVFGMYWCIIPAVVAGGLKEAFDKYTTGQFDIWDWIATALGGALVQLLVLISPLW